MKQLINIQAKYLKKDDLIFNPQNRVIELITGISFENNQVIATYNNSIVNLFNIEDIAIILVDTEALTINNSSVNTNSSSYDINTLFEMFKSYCKIEKNLDYKTLLAYASDLEQFIDIFKLNKLDVKDVDNSILSNYVQELNKKGYESRTIKRKIAVLKAFFNWLEYIEYIENSPFKKFKFSLKEARKLPKVISLKDIEKILTYLYEQKNICNVKTFKYKMIIRDILTIELLFSTGMRVSELSNLKLGQINLDNNSIKIWGKGSKERMIQIPNQKIISLIVHYLTIFNLKDSFDNNQFFLINRTNSNFSEQSIRVMILKYVKILGLNHITPHMFRHTFASSLLDEGVDTRYIQNMLGHASILTTQIYTKTSNEKQGKLLENHPRFKMNTNKVDKI